MNNSGPSVPPDVINEVFDANTFSMPVYTRGATTTVTTTAGDPWVSWGDSWSTGTATINYGNGYTRTYGNPPTVQRPEPTAAEQEERRRQREDYIARAARERDERMARRNAAEARAMELLRLVLLPDELARFDETGKVIITGSDGRRYEIGTGVVSNIFLLADVDDTRYRGRLASLCAHPNLIPGYDHQTGMYERDIDRDGLPQRDAHVGQILALRCDAPSIWRRANVDWYDLSETTRPLRDWQHEHKFRGGGDDATDTEGISDEARAAFPVLAPAEPEPRTTIRDRLGRFVGANMAA